MSATPTTLELNSGSYWHRWDPHIHAPGTHLNDNFTGADAWTQYLAKIEQANPIISALGVTDYCSLATYERVVTEKAKGRLPHVQLVFANVEMRLAVGTVKGKYVNIHLLICPDDVTHIDEAKRFMSRLKFEVDGDTFACTDADLAKLGTHTDRSLSGVAAMRKGVEQFKVELSNLRDAFTKSAWAGENILIGVAGAETDGSSGVRDGADAALRTEIEKFAHVIFASSPAQRAFWLGDGAATVAELEQKYGGSKPCIHGCDAHELAKVGTPDGDRYTWVKGHVAFDTLRQAMIDPRGRVFVGPQPPIGTIASQAISRVEIAGASWASTPKVSLNPGMVAIIGARGSGKSALAEMIALGCDSLAEHQNDNSFLRRAADLLTGVTAKVVWLSGEPVERRPQDGRGAGADRYSRARYLSQQFVEELCAADSVTDGLINEIQRVIYEAHPLTDRDGTSNFDELLDLRVAVLRQTRHSEDAALAELSERIGADREKQTLIPSLRAVITEKTDLVARYKVDRAKLVSKGSEERVKRLEALTQAAETVREYLRYFANQKQSLLALKQDVQDHRTRRGPEALRQSKSRFQPSGLKDTDWERFLLDFKGDVDAAITAYQAQNEKDTTNWKGMPPVPNADQNVAIITDDAKLDEQPLAILEAEIGRLQSLVNVDKDTASKFAAISKRVDEEAVALARLKERLTDCEGANQRITTAQQERESTYVRVFESIVSEQQVLTELYAPLRARIEKGVGALGKLSFTVKRQVDLDGWAERGESLRDLRVQGTFKGRGRLRQLAEASLKTVWEAGDPAAVGAAMSAFFQQNREELLGPSTIPPSELVNYRDWLKRFAKWLYSTDHITLQYSIDYDGVDIRKLSPGTRGIVLLLLYLALDDADDRPLIVDQPEENLDPKSIYDELVPLFRAAKAKRQVVLVTHNANLVVNTDADQVIVASAGAHAPGQLPPITYTSGGLEEAPIRKLVCDILEGGEAAFRERARRLRVRIER
ncbi:MAG: AAA family ATPase [Planctomycetes bacterium]|nr:AAA family ATPase [Planctomycetota bacterium]